MPELRAEFQDARIDRTRARLASATLKALRGHMTKAGQVRVNPWVSDEYEQAEREYRDAQEFDAPIYATAKFRIGAHWYLYDVARPVIRRALELGVRQSKRSSAAIYLEAALQGDEFPDRWRLRQATPKLLEIHGQLTPLN